MSLSTFESLPDEILMIIFQYIDDIYNLFQKFFCLNQRLNNILLDKRLHLFTNFLQINISHKNINYYYKSIIFQTVSFQLSSMNIMNENRLYQCFQSLISFYIKEQYLQMKFQVELKIEKLKLIRHESSPEEILYYDKNLKKSFEELKQNFPIKQIESYVYQHGACLQYTDHEQSGFYFAEDFRELFSRKFSFKIFQILFISNVYLLKYPCYYAGYSLTIYEYLLYSIYRLNTKDYRQTIDLILFTTHCYKYLSNGENWMEKIILIILDVLSNRRLIKDNEIFIQITQLEILKILLEEYLLLPISLRYEEDLTDRFRYIFEGLIQINRLDIIQLVYEYYKPFRDYFNNRKNVE